MLEHNPHLSFTLGFALFLTINYLLFSVGGYWFFYRYLGPDIAHRKILEKDATPKQMQLEKRRSFHTQIVFFIMAMGLYALYQNGFTRIYTGWDSRGILYFFVSYFFMHQLHDAYFYWTHRWMHEIKWLRKYHFVHHESAPPTPYSSLSFHPVEATVHGLFWYIIAFLYPIPAHWLFLFYSFMFYINMWGHTTYEFWHRDLLTHPFLKILNTPTHHNLHHKYHQHNYSIYYNFWDKLCGTNHPEYENHYRSVKAKTEAGKKHPFMKWMNL